jgi:hypothetical protein
MSALLILGLALPLFAAVAYGVVATEGYRETVVTGHRRTRATAAHRVTRTPNLDKVGWLTLAQSIALLAGVVLRACLHH